MLLPNTSHIAFNAVDDCGVKGLTIYMEESNGDDSTVSMMMITYIILFVSIQMDTVPSSK